MNGTTQHLLRGRKPRTGMPNMAIVRTESNWVIARQVAIRTTEAGTSLHHFSHGFLTTRRGTSDGEAPGHLNRGASYESALFQHIPSGFSHQSDTRRSDERRVGKDGVRTGRTRWSSHH